MLGANKHVGAVAFLRYVQHARSDSAPAALSATQAISPGPIKPVAARVSHTTLRVRSGTPSKPAHRFHAFHPTLPVDEASRKHPSPTYPLRLVAVLPATAWPRYSYCRLQANRIHQSARPSDNQSDRSSAGRPFGSRDPSCFVLHVNNNPKLTHTWQKRAIIFTIPRASHKRAPSALSLDETQHRPEDQVVFTSSLSALFPLWCFPRCIQPVTCLLPPLSSTGLRITTLGEITTN